MTEPVQTFRQRIDLTKKDARIYMSHNEFKDESDLLGLFKSNPDDNAFEFLAFENIMEDQISESQSLPWIRFSLSDTKRTYERNAYTFMMLLGDVGGIYSAIVGVPSYLISSYI